MESELAILGVVLASITIPVTVIATLKVFNSNNSDLLLIFFFYKSTFIVVYFSNIVKWLKEREEEKVKVERIPQ